ncbi:hypothetical protein E4U45_004643 [Claviceps purpurea]|nr:hypothetical protein E4U45_004643 [Claviceps purpurea]
MGDRTTKAEQKKRGTKLTEITTGAFSIDRFEDVFKFVDDYLDLGLSTDRVRNWCEFIWQDIGVLILLTELKERNIPIVIAHDDNFGFTKHAIKKHWDMYGVSHQLEAMRPSVHEVVVITKRLPPDDDGNITFLELGEQNKDADILPDD